MGEVIDPFANSSDEDLALRQEAGRAGWVADDDGWFWRTLRKGDVSLETGVDHKGDACGDDIGFTCDGRIYVPDCECALAYDRGETKLPRRPFVGIQT